MKLFTIVALFVFGMAFPAKADVVVTQFTWDRTGSEHLPCAGSVEWLLSPGSGITDATVGINDDDGVPDGHAWGMLYAWTTETFYITTTEPVLASDEVLVAFTGEAATQPTLSLVDCTETVTEPPVIPTTNPEPTLPTESPTTPTLVSWEIGFRVRTVRPTNVVAKWRIICDGVLTRGRLQARTPLSRTFTGFEGASECHITVRAWDIKPFAHPNDPTPPFPVVTTWVTHD